MNDEFNEKDLTLGRKGAHAKNDAYEGARDEAALPDAVEDDDYDDMLDEEDDEIGGYAYMQNRELSWLTFDERVLDQGADESVPLLERLNFISIFWSNLQEFFMVRVGSLTDLSYIEPPAIDSKTGMTPNDQIRVIHERCHELYPIQESAYEHVRGQLAKEGVGHLRPDDLSDEQRNYLFGLVRHNIEPFLSPQIINARHPFPHLENGKLYILVRLDDEASEAERKKRKKEKKKGKKEKGGAEGVVLGLIPLPHQCERVIKLPGRGYQFILLEHAIEMFVPEIFSMYKIKHTNVICVTRNADIDANQGFDEQDEDYREHMKRLLKQRARLAPVRLECERPLSPVMEKVMLKKLGLKRFQMYDTIVPLDLSFTWGLGSRLSEKKCARLSNPPFNPAWPTCFNREQRILDQVNDHDVLLSYPYESMDPFVQLLREAAIDPDVISIKITLYRLASQSHLAEALIAAADSGKEVTALFELRARFDENNNIEWSQRFEQAGCNVLYGFRDYKVHSKICCITRRTPDGGIQHITQLGTGNYNEKTARLYTDFSFITADEAFGQDAVEFFRNMQLENVSDSYEVLRVAPLQIKTTLVQELDKQIALARAGKPAFAFMKANSVTDKEIIEKISEASNAGVRITLFIRGICCLIPHVKGATENVRVVSIVGRLLEHSRIYCFGSADDCTVYLSSADLMTRNLNKRVEIAWPLPSGEIRDKVLEYIDVCMHDTAKLRELRPNATYTPLGAFCDLDEDGNPEPSFDAQAALIKKAADAAEAAEAGDGAEIADAAEAAEEGVVEDLGERMAEEEAADGSSGQPTERIPVVVVPDEEPVDILAETFEGMDFTEDFAALEKADQKAQAESDSEPESASPSTETTPNAEPEPVAEPAVETVTVAQNEVHVEPQPSEPEPSAMTPVEAALAAGVETQVNPEPSTTPESDKSTELKDNLTDLTIDEILSPMTLESFEVSPMPLPVAEAVPAAEAEQPTDVSAAAGTEAEPETQETSKAEAAPVLEPGQATHAEAADESISATAASAAEPEPAGGNKQRAAAEETTASNRVSELIAQLSATSGQNVPLQESTEAKPSFTLEVPPDPAVESATDPAPSFGYASEVKPAFAQEAVAAEPAPEPEPEPAPAIPESAIAQEAESAEPAPAAELPSEQTPAVKTEGVNSSEPETSGQPDEATSFLDAPNREIEIPAEKQGFFSRFRNKDK